jgi:hypothetical protein
VLKSDVEDIKGNGRFYFYLYPIGDLVQGNFHGSFYVCINQGSFLKSFLINSELKINKI